MKTNFLAFGLVLLLTISYGQNKNTAKADQLFETYQYVDAIDEYLRLAENKNASDYVYKQLADSYYNVFDNENAAKWYAKATENKADAETYYRYAQTLKTMGKYQEANKQLDVFAKMMPNDDRAKEHKANPNYIPSLLDSKLFDVAEIMINSKDQSDFGAVLTNDNILYFVSTRNSSNRTDKWNNQPYLDIYQSSRNAKGELSEPTQVRELNTPFHDGPVTISPDGNTMFFARDGLSEGQYQVSKKGNVRVGEQRLYRALKTNGKWGQVTPLPINNTSYSVTSPSLSKDGKTLYFASNMPGGLGESDIWKIAIKENGYGKPENLGPTVNTANKENFPFITEDNVLYFGSMGRQGYGGYDVFRINLNTSEAPLNLGKPVNSEKDDFSFSFNKRFNVGYFSTNRNGSDAIFSAVPTCAAQAIVTITNKKTGALLPNATVAIMDLKDNIIASKQTDATGKVSYEIACKTAYALQVTALNFEKGVFSVPAVSSGDALVDAALNPVEVTITDTEVILKNVYFEFNKSNITAQGANELDKLLTVMRDNPGMIIFVKSHTDSKGTPAYNLSLSERRAQSTVQYVISKGIAKARISGKGFGNTEPKMDCGSNCSEEQQAQNRRSEFLIVKK
jgi:outer membrane protein OmpA-like peptidoglycan-associated protein/tetratricopeptide (TPR) repeat protein